jgi:sugar phosphate isomerase/epimerase
MSTDRRQMLLAGAACLAGAATTQWATAIASDVSRPRTRPNSKINGVQIGVVSYSFRSLPDQSAEATLRYCRELGINAVELMGDPAESFAGIQAPFDSAKFAKVFERSEPGQPPLSPVEQQQHNEALAAYAEYRRQIAVLRVKATMRPFEQLRRLYNSAGVAIYAFKPDAFGPDHTDAEVDYGMRAAKSLGANQVTTEMPTDPAQVRRLATAATRHGLRIAYHAHVQASPTLWDAALAESPANAINLDLGHFVAAGDYDPLPFIRKDHARIASMHLKDRQTRQHGQANLPWGQGDTPIKAALQLMRDQHYNFPASIEFEYDIPPGSDAIKEVGKCLEYCRRALAYERA